MKIYLKLFAVLMLMIVSMSQASAQSKDGEATVTQGSTTTVSISPAYQSTLNRATGISYTWTAGSSAISIQSKTNKTCTIKGNTPGTTRLNYHCSYYIDGFYRTMDFYYDITVKSNTISVTRLVVSPESATLDVGESVRISVTVYPTNATNKRLIWESLNPNVATVDNSGLIKAVAPGRTSIMVAPEDNYNYQYWVSVTVNEPTKVASIELSETEKTLTEGESFELTAKVLPGNAYNKALTWTSSNEEVAMVNNGMVTATSPGECDITCKSTDGSNISATCHINVRDPEQYWLSVVIPNGNFSINVTGLEQIRLKITPDEGFNINSISLDGEYMIHVNGMLILPKLTHNSTLNVSFEDETADGIETVDSDNQPLKIMVSGHSVSVTGLPAAQKIYIYDTDGELTGMTTNDTFELLKSGVYILRIADRAYKIAVQ